jgi:hypothetical protein
MTLFARQSIPLHNCPIGNHNADCRKQLISKSLFPGNRCSQRCITVEAREWLAAPASLAVSERIFSAAGLTVTNRSRSSTDHVRKLVFLNTAWPALEATGVMNSVTARITAASLTSDKT